LKVTSKTLEIIITNYYNKQLGNKSSRVKQTLLRNYEESERRQLVVVRRYSVLTVYGPRLTTRRSPSVMRSVSIS